MSVRFPQLSAFYSRSTNVPNNASFSMLAWFRQVTDTNDFAVLFGLASGADGADLEFASDGSTLRCYSAGSAQDFATSPTLGRPFCAAIAASNNGANIFNVGYWRHADEVAWQVSPTVQHGIGAITVTALNIGNFKPSPVFGFDGDIWGVKVWDRTLTAEELLIESFYAGVKFPTSLNSFFTLESTADAIDRSGQGRDLITEGSGHADSSASWKLWRPGARVIRSAGVATFIAPKIHQLRQQGFL